MKKVVYNNKFGGFGLSRAAIERMVALGHPIAEKMLDFYIKNNCTYSYYTDDPDFRIRRHDPILIQTVEELGEEAAGDCCSLRVQEIDDHDHYEIKEFDGKETLKILNLYCDCCP